MTRFILELIENCGECRHADHSGAFTPGGARPICGHPDVIEARGFDWAERIRPAGQAIPDWCPLPESVH